MRIKTAAGGQIASVITTDISYTQLGARFLVTCRSIRPGHPARAHVPSDTCSFCGSSPAGGMAGRSATSTWVYICPKCIALGAEVLNVKHPDRGNADRVQTDDPSRGGSSDFDRDNVPPTLLFGPVGTARYTKPVSSHQTVNRTPRFVESRMRTSMPERS